MSRSLRKILSEQPIRDFLMTDGWRTPDTYGGEFEEIPGGRGVYAFVRVLINDTERIIREGCWERVVYVGMSEKLSTRISGHEVMRFEEDWCQRWHKVISGKASLRPVERFYIQKFQPVYNIVGKQEPILSRRLAS